MQYASKGKLYHRTPGWVREGEVFHIRIRCDQLAPTPLTEPVLARPLLESVANYHARGRWHCSLFLIMPDHLHALLAFPKEPGMSVVVRQWKAYHARRSAIRWQDGYFDHRIRNECEFDDKARYIRRNPLAKGLCECEADWRWVVGAGDLEA